MFSFLHSAGRKDPHCICLEPAVTMKCGIKADKLHGFRFGYSISQFFGGWIILYSFTNSTISLLTIAFLPEIKQYHL
jgi:hypothetical protein